MQALMGIPSATASTLCIVGSPFASQLAVSCPFHPLHPSPRILSSNCRCGPPSLFTSGAMSEASATQRGGETQAAASPLPFPRCVSVSAC